jgi:hypothetical protein
MSTANRNPIQVLEDGRKILDPVLVAHGFEFQEGPQGSSSGGEFACGEYIRGDRRLEIHFRFELGLVTYHIGSSKLLHTDYMRALLAKAGGSRYPGFSDDPLDAFRDLAYDVEHFCSDFLSGDGAEFKRCAQTVLPSGLDAI